jgi:hypothetical protein
MKRLGPTRYTIYVYHNYYWENLVRRHWNSFQGIRTSGMDFNVEYGVQRH